MIPILYFQCDYIFYVEAIWIWEEIQLAGLFGQGEWKWQKNSKEDGILIRENGLYIHTQYKNYTNYLK